MRFKLGDWIQVPDGRVGTMVYNGLDGVGIKWGEIRLTNTERDFILGLNPLFGEQPIDAKLWAPDVMLREKEYCERWGYEFVGNEKDCVVVKRDERNEN